MLYYIILYCIVLYYIIIVYYVCVYISMHANTVTECAHLQTHTHTHTHVYVICGGCIRIWARVFSRKTISPPCFQ